LLVVKHTNNEAMLHILSTLINERSCCREIELKYKKYGKVKNLIQYIKIDIKLL